MMCRVIVELVSGDLARRRCVSAKREGAFQQKITFECLQGESGSQKLQCLKYKDALQRVYVHVYIANQNLTIQMLPSFQTVPSFTYFDVSLQVRKVYIAWHWPIALVCVRFVSKQGRTKYNNRALSRLSNQDTQYHGFKELQGRNASLL
jgi:hypothetical protein